MRNALDSTRSQPSRPSRGFRNRRPSCVKRRTRQDASGVAPRGFCAKEMVKLGVWNVTRAQLHTTIKAAWRRSSERGVSSKFSLSGYFAWLAWFSLFFLIASKPGDRDDSSGMVDLTYERGARLINRQQSLRMDRRDSARRNPEFEIQKVGRFQRQKRRKTTVRRRLR